MFSSLESKTVHGMSLLQCCRIVTYKTKLCKIRTKPIVNYFIYWSLFYTPIDMPALYAAPYSLLMQTFLPQRRIAIYDRISIVYPILAIFCFIEKTSRKFRISFIYLQLLWHIWHHLLHEIGQCDKSLKKKVSKYQVNYFIIPTQTPYNMQSYQRIDRSVE